MPLGIKCKSNCSPASHHRDNHSTKRRTTTAAKAENSCDVKQNIRENVVRHSLTLGLPSVLPNGPLKSFSRKDFTTNSLAAARW